MECNKCWPNFCWWIKTRLFLHKNEETLESHFVNQTDKLSNIRIENHGRLVQERSGLSPTWMFLLQASRVGCVVIALGYKNCPLAASALQFSSTIKKTTMALERQVRMKVRNWSNFDFQSAVFSVFFWSAKNAIRSFLWWKKNNVHKQCLQFQK